MAEKAPELIPDDVKKVLKDTFLSELRDDVLIEVFTQPGVNDSFNEATVQMIRTFAELSPKIKASFHTVGDEQARKRNVLRSPTILISPDRYRIRSTGAPLGEEGRSFLLTLLMVSTGRSRLSSRSVERLSKLSEKRDIQVYVSPTCPYCPQQVLVAAAAAVARPDLISAETVEIYENQDLARQLGSTAVPQTYVNGIFIGAGLQPEDSFVESLLSLKEPQFLSEEITPGGPVEKDLVIIGGGPAGLTAAVYAVRAGLDSIVIEKTNLGGQVAITPVVENYPGFMRIGGKSLVDLLVQQAAQYAEIHLGELLKGIEQKDGLYHVQTNRATYIARGLILATGVENRALDAQGAQKLYGRGVSYCATCDGYFFKDGKKVIVVGGGNTAVTDALYLKNIGSDVTLVHWKDALRAEARLQESLKHSGIPVLWNSEVKEISGEKTVRFVKIMNNKTGAVTDMDADGVFVAIGYVPGNAIAKMLGLALDKQGYIKADLTTMRTSLPRVYAAGDITGAMKQIAVAVGQGSIAAMSAFEDISDMKGIKKETAVTKTAGT